MALCYFNGTIMNIGKVANFSECKKFECKDSEITAKLIKLPSQDKGNLNNCKLTGKIEYDSEQHLENKYSNHNYFEAEWIERPVFSEKYLGSAAELFNGKIDFETYMDNTIRKNNFYTGGEIEVDNDGIYNNPSCS
jgi:hypothetical protein